MSSVPEPVIDPLVIDPVVIDPAGGLDHQFTKALEVEAGAAQHRRHQLVGEQIIEGRLITAAFGVSSHNPLPTSKSVINISEKDVLIVTQVRNFRGNFSTDPPEFSFERNRPDRLRLDAPGPRIRPLNARQSVIIPAWGTIPARECEIGRRGDA